MCCTDDWHGSIPFPQTPQGHRQVCRSWVAARVRTGPRVGPRHGQQDHSSAKDAPAAADKFRTRRPAGTAACALGQLWAFSSADLPIVWSGIRARFDQFGRADNWPEARRDTRSTRAKMVGLVAGFSHRLLIETIGSDERGERPRAATSQYSRAAERPVAPMNALTINP